MKLGRILAWGLSLALGASTMLATAAGDGMRVPLGGHVPAALGAARLLPPSLLDPKILDDALTLTIVLQRSDQAGFEQFLRDVYDPQSPQYRKFATPVELAERYGPAPDAYAQVRTHFEREGFSLVADSANRLTLTLRTSRSNAERVLAVRIADYRIGDRTFHANDTDPTLPAEIANKVAAIVGLNGLARPEPQWNAIVKAFQSVFYQLCKLAEGPAPTALNNVTSQSNNTPPASQCVPPPPDPTTQVAQLRTGPHAAMPWKSARGFGQKVGILAYDTFVPSDVANFLAFAELPAGNIANLSQVHVNGGATLGANQDEVLLDITTVMAVAPGAQVVLYDAPSNASFQSIFNAMVNDRVTVISNSWAYCEDQTTLSDVQSLDAIFQAAAAAGISVFNASGDTGTTCLNGAPNTVAVPASAPNATAVGGTSLTTGPGGVYISEKWWNGTADTPSTGQGGYGVSRFFNRPAYQNGFTTSSMRSVPDVAVNSDPAKGVMICKESGGGCPTGGLFGGTSIGAPYWAAFTAVLNEAQGQNVGFINPQVYPLAATPAFHGAASMGSDFAHVGLGSPNMNRLHLALAGQAPGPVSAVTSTVVPYTFGFPPAPGTPIPAPPADGATTVQIVVSLRDIDGNMVAGKTVALAKNAGSSAVITPASGVSSAANGAVVFTVTNLAAENVTFTATNVTDNMVLTAETVRFDVPSAAAASISAAPTNILNNGIAATTITVTLQDALGRPTPGKLIALSQGSGRSQINGPSPSVTGANGTIQFTATNQFPEVVTYTAIDVTDGNLPIPGSAVVTFGGQGSVSCLGAMPTAAPGFTFTPFITGFQASPLFFGNVNWGCRGASFPAFATDGSVFVNNFPDGGVYKLPPEGGAATGANELAVLGPALFGPVVGKDGRIYTARGATTGNFFTGAIYELDPMTGAIARTVLANVLCPTGLAVDPLSGDLFFSVSCFGAGSDNPSLFRVSNPASATPTLSVYTTLPGTPTGWIAFAPDGTIFMPQIVTNPTGAPMLRISGTNVPGTPTQTPVPGLSTLYWVTVGEVLPNGAAKSLIILDGTTLNVRLADITTNPPTYTDLIIGGIGTGVVGPDGCLYTSAGDSIYKLAPSGGGCGFAPTSPGPAFELSPASVTPAAAQGTTHTLTAQFRNLSVPAGTGVTFRIEGANEQLRSAITDASGQAVITYQGVLTGSDRIVATATVNGNLMQTNEARITWTATGGRHATFVSVNGMPGSGTVGIPVTLTAALFDVAVTPNAPVAGATIAFTMGAQSCNGVTNGSGIANCGITPITAGLRNVIANFAGNATLMPSASGTSIQVLGPPSTALATSASPMPVGTAFTLTATVTGTNPTGTVSFRNESAPLPGCTAVPLTGSGNTKTAQCTVSSLGVGSYALTADYSGDGSNFASTATLLQVVSANAGPPCGGFPDVDPVSPFCPNVEWLKNRQVTLGCVAGLYCPDASVLRLSMAAFMNRLGTASTDIVLPAQGQHVAFNIDAAPVVCQTTNFAVTDFPRLATVDAVMSGVGFANVDYVAEPVATFDGGTTWAPLTSTALATSTAPSQWRNVRVNGVRDLDVGQTVRFGVRVSRGGFAGAGMIAEVRCNLRTLIGNRVTDYSPLDR